MEILDLTSAPLPLKMEWIRLARDPEKLFIARCGQDAYGSLSRMAEHGRSSMLAIAATIAGAPSLVEAAEKFRKQLLETVAICAVVIAKIESGRNTMAADLPRTSGALLVIGLSLEGMRSAIQNLLSAFDHGTEAQILAAAICCSEQGRAELRVGGESVN